MADRRSQSDESLIVEYFTIQPLAACDALLNQIADILRKRRPKRTESGNNAKSATEPAERKPSQKRKAGKEAAPTDDKSEDVNLLCGRCKGATVNHNIHQLQSFPGYHEFVEPAGEAKGATGGD